MCLGFSHQLRVQAPTLVPPLKAITTGLATLFQVIQQLVNGIIMTTIPNLGLGPW